MFRTCFAPTARAAVQLIRFYFLPMFLPSLDLLHYFLALTVTCSSSLLIVISKFNCYCVAIYIDFPIVSRNADLTVVRVMLNMDFDS